VKKKFWGAWVLLLVVGFMLAAGGCGGGGGDGGGGAVGSSINGTWKIYAIIDEKYNQPIYDFSPSDLTITVTRDSVSGEIRLSGKDVDVVEHPQGAVRITTSNNVYSMHGVPSSELEESDDSYLPEGARLDVYSYKDSSGGNVTFTYLTGISGDMLDYADVLTYEVWGYKIAFTRN
jgi:hypothetical protein